MIEKPSGKVRHNTKVMNRIAGIVGMILGSAICPAQIAKGGRQTQETPYIVFSI